MSSSKVKILGKNFTTFQHFRFGHQYPITSIDALYKERALTSGGVDRTLRVWKIVDESQLVYSGHIGSIDCVRYVNEEVLLTCGDDGSLCVWSLSKKKPVAEHKLAHGLSSSGVPNWISSIATLANSDLIASGSCDGFIRVWSLGKSYREIKLKFEIPAMGFVNSLVFTNNGASLIAGIGQEHRLGRWWRLKEAKNVIQVIPFQSKE